MATHSAGAAPGTSNMPGLVRALLVVMGMALGFVGVVAWSLEAEYGAGTNHVVETDSASDVGRVYEVDEQTGTQELLFEGTVAEAEAFAEERRTTGRNFLIPVLLIAGGAGLFAFGIWPRRHTTR